MTLGSRFRKPILDPSFEETIRAAIVDLLAHHYSECVRIHALPYRVRLLTNSRIRLAMGSRLLGGEGHRKITAYLRRKKKVHVGRKRVLRIIRANGVLAPQRDKKRRKARPHDGTIIPEAPDLLWGTDATMAWTKKDGWGVGLLLRRPLHL